MRYNVRVAHATQKREIKYLEKNRPLTGDPASGKKGGTPTKQREFFATKLQDAIDDIEAGRVKIRGKRKKDVIERLKKRKRAVLQMNAAYKGGGIRGGPAMPGSGKGNLSRRGK